MHGFGRKRRYLAWIDIGADLDGYICRYILHGRFGKCQIIRGMLGFGSIFLILCSFQRKVTEYNHPNIKIVFCNGLRMKLQEHAGISFHVLQLLQ